MDILRRDSCTTSDTNLFSRRSDPHAISPIRHPLPSPLPSLFYLHFTSSPLHLHLHFTSASTSIFGCLFIPSSSNLTSTPPPFIKSISPPAPRSCPLHTSYSPGPSRAVLLNHPRFSSSSSSSHSSSPSSKGAELLLIQSSE